MAGSTDFYFFYCFSLCAAVDGDFRGFSFILSLYPAD